jgi:ATP-dependent Lon protease
MFVATSNSMNIPPALLDRMEVIRLSGYTEDEKLNIAQRYLLPEAGEEQRRQGRRARAHRGAVRGIIRYYTREAGVRSLEREISKICRKVVKGVPAQEVRRQGRRHRREPERLPRRAQVRLRPGREEEPGRPGGGPRVDGSRRRSADHRVRGDDGKGNIIRTGSLGDVMKESVEAARSVVRQRARRLGIKDELFEKRDIHIHVPDGATPKDGPSAGIAMTTAFVSALTGIPVRADVAMTGEITLRGEVTAIGGLKEKLLAAHRGGIKVVMIPEENVKDLQDIPRT